MPEHIASPVVIQAAGTKPKLIEEYVAVCTPAFSPALVHREES